MADARSRSNTSTQTCQLLPCPIEAVRIFPVTYTGFHEEVYQQPTYATAEKGLVDAEVQALASPARIASREEPFGLSAPLFRPEIPDHDPFHQKDASVKMFKSPPGSAKEISNHASTPRNKPRDVSSPSLFPSQMDNDNPARQDSAYYSTNDIQDNISELDVDIQARQMRAREPVERLRRKVFRTRLAMKDRRETLRTLRENSRDAEEKLMRKMDELMALNKVPDLSDIRPYYEALREARDALGPAEETYDRLQNRLENEQQDLEEEEDHFYRHFDVSVLSVAEPRFDIISPRVKPDQLQDNEIQSLNIENNQFRMFLEKFAQAQNLKVDLDELEDDYYQYSMEWSFRTRHRIPLSTETAAFLKDFENLHADALDALYTVENDLLNLRDECLKQGIFTESEHIYEPRNAFRDDVMDAVYEARDRSSLHVAANHLDYPAHNISFEDRKDYVNKWLLKWVQDSSIEVLMLRKWIYYMYPDEGKGLTEKEWSELAVENWDHDSAGEFTNERYNASRMDAIAGEDDTGGLWGTTTRQTGLSVNIPSLEAALEEIGVGEAILGSDTSSYATRKVDMDITPTRRRRPSSV